MKVFKYLILGVISFYMFGIISVKALSNITILGNSVFRESATQASINFISNTDGTIYYIVNEIPSINIENFNLISSAGDITSNITKTINISLSSGVKYVHIVVKDNSNNYSNILTIPLLNNLYYFDDFEAYNIGSYPNYFTIRHNGSNASLQKVIDLNGNKVFNAYGTYGTGLDERIQINALTTGYAVLEADISASVLPNNYYFGGIVIGANYNNDDRNIIVQVNPYNKNIVDIHNNVSNIIFEANKKYHLRIVVDIINKKYDYYINGIKCNLQPINAISFNELNWFGIYNGSGTVYYDNIKFYSQDTNPDIYSIIKGIETNGTFQIDKTESKKDEVVTITPNPEIGYRVKSVKINNNESGITNNSTNYTFIMPNEDVTVMVEFEKIPFTITTDSVLGATINPTGTINVEYGDNQDITIKANKGYRLKSVKVNNIEKLPLIDNKITIYNITENKTVEVKTEKTEYEVIYGNNKSHKLKEKENIVLKIDADKSLFNKVYLNNEELDSKHYIVTEGSTIITLKQEFLNSLLTGTYNLKITFNDGKEAYATFLILEPSVDNPKTGDQIVLSIILGSISLLGLIITIMYRKKLIN